jgi:hypothetical protein
MSSVAVRKRRQDVATIVTENNKRYKRLTESEEKRVQRIKECIESRKKKSPISQLGLKKRM